MCSGRKVGSQNESHRVFYFYFILFFKKLGVFYHRIFRLLIQNSGVVTEIRPKRTSPDKERLFGFKDWQESFLLQKSLPLNW